MEKLLYYTGKDLQDLSLESWMQTKSPALKPSIQKWCALIRACGDDVQQVFHDNCPVGCVKSAPFAYVNAFASHVNIGFYYGAFLQDPKKLLLGKGKRMRHIKLFPDIDSEEKAIRDLITLSYLDIKERLKGR